MALNVHTMDDVMFRHFIHHHLLFGYTFQTMPLKKESDMVG